MVLQKSFSGLPYIPYKAVGSRVIVNGDSALRAEGEALEAEELHEDQAHARHRRAVEPPPPISMWKPPQTLQFLYRIR